MGEKFERGKVRIRSRAVKIRHGSLQALIKLVFSRVMLTALLVMIQALFLFGVFSWMGNYSKIVMYSLNILAAILVIGIINSNDNPAFKMTWMIFLCAFPLFGIFLYIIIQINPARYGTKKALHQRIGETAPFLQPNLDTLERIVEEKEPVADIAYYIQNINGFPIYDKTKVKYFSCGEEKLRDLLPELEKAEKFIFLEYFIIAPGKVWDQILEVLERKAAAGVEVRVMYDGFCAMLNLPIHYSRKLREKGILAKSFSPVIPLLSSHQNYRDHRKILVIDGKVAYNGGINLADEYMNLIVRFGHWKDTAVKLEGDAVKSFTAMFLQIWNMTERGSEDYGKYLNVDAAPDLSGEVGYVMPYDDDPCNGEDVAEEIYIDILSKAQNYVYIMTPYLVPENEIITALRFAAQRGVDVRIIMPHIPDKKITFSIGHTYYMQLLEAGVKIYEYTPGFVHAKMFLSDDVRGVVGTINLDFRSLYEHYECATFMYKSPALSQMKADFRKTFEKCQRFYPEDYKKLPLYMRMIGRVFRLLAPLM